MLGGCPRLSEMSLGKGIARSKGQSNASRHIETGRSSERVTRETRKTGKDALIVAFSQHRCASRRSA